MTQACPLACLHCPAGARPDRHSGELTTAEARDLMAQVAEFGCPPPIFVLTGGDPLQRPDLFDLIRHGTALWLPVAVSPSGTPTLTADRLAELRDAGARAISLSLDGSTAEVHDRFRGVPGGARLDDAGMAGRTGAWPEGADHRVTGGGSRTAPRGRRCSAR